MNFTMTSTPNPNALKFTAEGPLFSNRVEVFKDDQTNSPFLTKLIEIDGVISLFGFNDFVTICKSPDAAWENLLPHVKETLEKF
ncbi:NifU N-terminal domain-containing protein [Sporolactobacillus sp. STSJ-5]|uniref:NifU N-terminal domain-containing protein n=1 Tax=Sporolactobacillus sp. STSJ-5 TaxID=2965076 RepID=UPI0021031F6B|nr:NifU N-terminal domain-containing protein [Sporolactobacillus sp. STSJ-5]MCQ2009444.1 NifU N-terminal domain-containing protein [Sporolactobacillus sp. STSJ-5]